MATEVLSHRRVPLTAKTIKATPSTFSMQTPINKSHRQTDKQIQKESLASTRSSVLLPLSPQEQRQSNDTKKSNLPSPRRLTALSIKSGLSRMLCDFGGSNREFDDRGGPDMTFFELELERNRRKDASEISRQEEDWDAAHKGCWESFKQQYTQGSCDGTTDGTEAVEAPIIRSDTASSSRSASPTENRVLSNDVQGSRLSRSDKTRRIWRRSATPIRTQMPVPNLNGSEVGRPPLFVLGEKATSLRGIGSKSQKESFRKGRLIWRYSSPYDDQNQEPLDDLDAASTTAETSVRSSASFVDYSDDDLLKDSDSRFDDISVDFVVSSRATSPARWRVPSPVAGIPRGRPYTPPPPLQSITATMTLSTDNTGSRSPPSKHRRTAKPKLRFADELGIPLAEVKYVQTEFSTEEVHCVRRIMVLLLSPVHRRFELIHVSYQQQFQHRMTIAQVVEQIAPMATDKKLRRQKYTGLACRRKDPVTKKIHAEELLNTLCIQDYELVKNEVLVALVKGYKSKELMNMAEALLRNKKVLRAVKLGTASKQSVKKLESGAPGDGVELPTEATLMSPNANKKHKESFGERYPKKVVSTEKHGDEKEEGGNAKLDGMSTEMAQRAEF